MNGLEQFSDNKLIHEILNRIYDRNRTAPCIENDAASAHLHGALRWLSEVDAKNKEKDHGTNN